MTGISGPGTCGCCNGLTVRTPAVIENRPGLAEVRYRSGVHGDFLASMLARLSSDGQPALAGLRTRDGDDLTIALLDAWAVACDVLTFYTERLANESYLRTATERTSLQELGQARRLSVESRRGGRDVARLRARTATRPACPGSSGSRSGAAGGT